MNSTGAIDDSGAGGQGVSASELVEGFEPRPFYLTPSFSINIDNADRVVFESVQRELEHNDDYGLSTGIHEVVHARFSEEQLHLFWQWRIEDSATKRMEARKPEVTVRRIRDSVFQDIASRASLRRHLSDAVFGRVPHIPLGQHCGRGFFLQIATSPWNREIEPCPLGRPEAEICKMAPAVYFWVRPQGYEDVMTDRRQHLQPERTYGYCSSLPIYSTTVVFAGARRSVSAESGFVEGYARLSYPEDGGSQSQSETTPGQLPRLHVGKTRQPIVMQFSSVDHASLGTQHPVARLSDALPFHTRQSGFSDTALSAPSSRQSSSNQSRQTSASLSPRPSSLLSSTFDTASTTYSGSSPITTPGSFSPVSPSNMGMLSLGPAAHAFRYLSHPFFHLGYVVHQTDEIRTHKGRRGWTATHHFVAVSMLDSSVWLFYDAWEPACDFDDMPPEEWDDVNEVDNPPPTHARFRPGWDANWACLGGGGGKDSCRSVMVQIADHVRSWSALGNADAELVLGKCVFPPGHFPVLLSGRLGTDGAILPPSTLRSAS